MSPSEVSDALALLCFALLFAFVLGMVIGFALAHRPPDSTTKRALMRQWSRELDDEVSEQIRGLRG